MSLGATSTPKSGADTQGRRLESWQEIAVYVGLPVTTVRRGEKRGGLPVHRHVHHKLGSVYAYTTEVDAWRSKRAPGQASNSADTGSFSEPVQRGNYGRTAIALTAVALALAPALLGVLGDRPRNAVRA